MWRAGEAVFAQESELLSEVPAEPGLCQADSGAREGDAGRAACFHRKPGAGSQKYGGAHGRQAVREERGGDVSLL